MIRLSKKLLYAIEAVLQVALHSDEAPVRSSDITEREGIPKRYLEPVLQELTREGILLSIRGPAGGYRLGRERRRISVGDIVRIVRGLETAEDPMADTTSSVLGHQVVRPLWQQLEDETMRRLDGITMEDLCVRSAAVRAPRQPDGHAEPLLQAVTS